MQLLLLGVNHRTAPVEVREALSFGPEEARVVEDRLLSGYRQAFDMPRAEALLLALRQVRPNVADAVLQRSGELYATSGAA